LLLESGADSAIVSQKGLSPLHLSCSERHYEIVELLAKSGADPNHQDKVISSSPPLSSDSLQWGNTALHVCVSDAKITSLLLIHGANPNLKNTVHSSSFFSLAEIPQDGETPLHAAAYRGELDTATLLVSHGALLDLRNNVTSPSSLLLSSCMTQTFFPLPHL
jgi:ankyrin repeat protein